MIDEWKRKNNMEESSEYQERLAAYSNCLLVNKPIYRQV